VLVVSTVLDAIVLTTVYVSPSAFLSSIKLCSLSELSVHFNFASETEISVTERFVGGFGTGPHGGVDTITSFEYDELPKLL